MIEIENNKYDITLVEDKERKDLTRMILNNCITIGPRQMYSFNTGITINCSEDMDECIIKGGEVEGDTMYIVTKRYMHCDGKSEVIMEIINLTDKIQVLPKDMEFGRIYRAYINDGSYRISKNLIIYNDDKIICESIDNKIRDYKINILPDGKRQLIIDMD